MTVAAKEQTVVSVPRATRTALMITARCRMGTVPKISTLSPSCLNYYYYQRNKKNK